MAESRALRATGWAAFALLFAALAIAGYWLLFTTFMLYDDEGYVLLSLKNYAQGGGLYDRVYSQYGPFPYVFYDALHRIGLFSFTSSAGRIGTLLAWLTAAGASAAVVYRSTRTFVLSVFTFVGVFAYLWIMINEPSHPGGLLAAGVAAMAWFGFELWAERRTRAFAIATGVAIAVLALTKINVGALAALAVGLWLAVHHVRESALKPIRLLLAAGCAALPLALMHTLIDEPWVGLFSLIFACSSIALVLELFRQRQARTPVSWTWFIGSAAGAATLVCGAVLLRGTSLSALVQGIAVGPLRHPGVYSFAMNWRPGTGIAALVSVAAAVTLTLRNGLRSRRVQAAIAIARGLAAAAFCAAAFQIVPTPLAALGMCFGIPLAWLLAVPLRPDHPRPFTGAWLATLLVFQFLQAYPIAGSQLNWGTFLVVPLLAWSLHDAAGWVRRTYPVRAVHVLAFGAAALAATSLFMVIQFARIGWQRYSGSLPLDLPGARDLRLPNPIRCALRIMDENLRAHAHVAFSLPGTFSPNLWSGVATPTPFNVTHWFSLLTEAQQQQIAQHLRGDARSSLLVQRYHLDYLAEHHFSTDSGLTRWLAENYAPALVVDTYELWLPRGRKIAAFSTASVVTSATAPDAAIDVVLQPTAAPIHMIDVCDVDAPLTPLLRLEEPDATLTTTRIDASGASLAEAAPAQWPLTLDGPARVRIAFARGGVPLGPSTLLRFRDASGRVVAEARVIPAPVRRPLITRPLTTPVARIAPAAAGS